MKYLDDAIDQKMLPPTNFVSRKQRIPLVMQHHFNPAVAQHHLNPAVAQHHLDPAVAQTARVQD